MPWGLWSSPPGGGKGDDRSNKSSSEPGSSSTTGPKSTTTSTTDSAASIDKTKLKTRSWDASLNATDWEHYKEPRTWILPVLAAGFALGFYSFYRSYLRRFPGTAHISPGLFRRRGLLGEVTSVGDGDNFHLFHTPGGRLAGWGWLRKVPKERKELKGRTIPIRIAGIDAPEGAHFGKPAQPFSAEALSFLRTYLIGRRVRAYIYRRDQYERVVASVFVRRPPFFIPRRDVGLEMLRRGLATTYEAKTGAEFGGPVAEAKYRAAEAEARRKGKGLWAAEKSGFFGLRKGVEVESPRSYKERMKELDKEKEGR